MKKVLYILIFLCLATNLMAEEKNHNFTVAKNLETFTSIYKNLDMLYVDTLDADITVEEGIRAMLGSLDPYTEYYSASETKDLKQMLTGKYAGIGASIRKNMKTGEVMIDEPYEGMPAALAGLRVGDVILAIDDSTMVGKPVGYISSRLRGDAGTTLLLKYRRPTVKKNGGIMKAKITRKAIQLPSIPYYGMLGDGIGYLLLTQYTEDCARDVRRALVDLRVKGMKGLVFDLRNNGGGSLQEAIKIVNMFVPKGVTLVTTKGKIKRSNSVYKTEAEPLDSVMPVVVLVNENTASASEITAGSLQDLDRAVIMGARTYGKGLVQQTVDLPHDGSLKLTVSKYYIPSGRCIQAINYKHTGGGYREHIPDSLTREFRTRGGRIVRDGGGIKPDLEVKGDTLSNVAMYLCNAGMDSTEVMHYYVVDYIDSHETIASPEEFHLTDADYAELKARIVASGFKYDRETSKKLQQLVDLAKFEGYYDDAKEEFEALEHKLQHNLEKDLDASRDVISQLVEQAIVTHYYYQKGGVACMLERDSRVKAAKELLLNEKEYNNILKSK